MINTATNYQSGAELHFEGALNEHFPFGLAAGVGGYKQLTPDGGSGDMVGAFGGRVAAIGSLLSYTLLSGSLRGSYRGSAENICSQRVLLPLTGTDISPFPRTRCRALNARQKDSD
jgi:Putative MetA-pathway of phenol degradation